MSLPDEDRLAINRYYSRREAFPSITPIPVGATLRSALEEQRKYDSINLDATATGGQRMTLNGTYGAYYSVSLYSSAGLNKYPFTGLSGTLYLIDEFDNVLLTKDVRVDSPESELRFALLWLPMNEEQEKILSKISYHKLSICLKADLKLRDDRNSVSTIHFPLCYRQGATWKIRFEALR